MSDKSKFLHDTYHYFLGAFSIIDDNLPDGAWYQMHIDSAEYLITDKECIKDMNGICDTSLPKNIDADDIVSYYMEKQSNERNPT